VTKGLLALSAIVAGVVKRGKCFVFALVDLDSPGLDVLLQEIVDRDDLVLLQDFRVPVLQTKPGRIIGVPSLG
jgi:hypothetical protein